MSGLVSSATAGRSAPSVAAEHEDAVDEETYYGLLERIADPADPGRVRLQPVALEELVTAIVACRTSGR